MSRLETTGLILCLVFTGIAFSQDRASLTVGTATAARGQKVSGVIEVPAGVDPGTNIPVVVIHGAKAGPILALVSGAHGTEYASIIAVEKLIDKINPANLSGSVILVPLVNIASFLQKVPHVNPVDGKSMNRFYPGKLDGTQTERASYLITKQVVEQSDYLVDYHGGDLDESLRPYSYWVKTGNERQDAVTREMVLAFGLDHIIISSDRPKDPNASRYLDNTANTRGKPAITVEAGYAGTVDPEDVSALEQGTLNVMRYLKMLPGMATRVEHPVWLERIVTVESEQTGVFYPAVKKGTYVASGTKIGEVTDFVNKKIYEAHAPVSGVITYLCAVPSMKKGDPIANIGVVAAESR